MSYTLHLIFAVLLLPVLMNVSGRRMRSPCVTVYRQIWCAGVGLRQVPVVPDPHSNNATYLDISHNSIHSVTWQLRAYPFLVYLNLARNYLSYIRQDAFDDLSCLTELNISGNKLKSSTLSTELFQPLSNLRILSMNNNQLGPEFDLSTFRHLQRITELNLDYNNIVNLTVSTVNRSSYVFPNLTELRLRGNSLVAIPVHIWRVTPQLILLDLSRNRFTSIPNGSFTGLHALKVLLLNEIPNLKTIDTSSVDCHNIQDLEISGNPNLVNIEPNAFTDCEHLENLHLNNNGLVSLPPDLFPWMKLKNVHLYGNKWQCDCNATWLIFLASVGKIVDGDKTECAAPLLFRKQPVLKMRDQEYFCLHGFKLKEDRSLNPGQVIAIILPAVLASFILLLLELTNILIFCNQRTSFTNFPDDNHQPF